MNFLSGAFRLHIGLKAKFEFFTRTTNEGRLKGGLHSVLGCRDKILKILT